MKKNLAMILVCTLLLTVISGCGNTTTKPPSTTPSTPSTTPSTPSTTPSTPAIAPAAPSTTTSKYDLSPYTKEKPLKLTTLSFSQGGATSAQNAANTAWAKAVLEKSGGAIVLEVLNDGVMAKSDREQFEGMQLGNFDFGWNNVPTLTNYVDEYKVLDIPFLFNGYKHVYKFIGSDVETELRGKLAKANCVMLGMEFYGFRHLCSNVKPVVKPEDMKGLLLRVIESALYTDLFKALGAAPVPMPSSELMIALQQGTVKGMDNNWNVIWNNGYCDLIKYISLTGHTSQFQALSASKKTWDKLPVGVQKFLQDVAFQVCLEGSKILEKQDAEYQKKAIDKGVKVNEVDHNAFVKALSGVRQKYSEQYSDLFKRITALDTP